MPYIDRDARDELDTYVEPLADCLSLDDPGEVNYCITRLLHLLLKAKGLRYKNICTVQGILSGVDKELQRAVIGPYEQGKRLSNGDIGVLDATP